MSQTSRLQELREQIDPINLQILELLNQRAEIALEIGKVQQQLGTRFYDPQREAEMLTALQLVNDGPFSNETISKLFHEIFRRHASFGGARRAREDPRAAQTTGPAHSHRIQQWLATRQRHPSR